MGPNENQPKKSKRYDRSSKIRSKTARPIWSPAAASLDQKAELAAFALLGS